MQTRVRRLQEFSSHPVSGFSEETGRTPVACTCRVFEVWRGESGKFHPLSPTIGRTKSTIPKAGLAQCFNLNDWAVAVTDYDFVQFTKAFVRGLHHMGSLPGL